MPTGRRLRHMYSTRRICTHSGRNKPRVFSPYKHYDNCDDLRASGAYKVYRPKELIDAARDMVSAQPIMFHPLCGGIHPDLAWQSLELFIDEVMPTLREEGIA